MCVSPIPQRPRNAEAPAHDVGSVALTNVLAAEDQDRVSGCPEPRDHPADDDHLERPGQPGHSVEHGAEEHAEALEVQCSREAPGYKKPVEGLDQG